VLDRKLAAALSQTINHPAVIRVEFSRYFHSLIEDALGHGDAGIAGSTQRLICVIVTDPSSESPLPELRCRSSHLGSIGLFR